MKKWFYIWVFVFLLLPTFCLSEKVDIKVEDIMLSETDIMIIKGKAATIKATCEPANAKNKKVEWTSTNESIATVTNGRIHGKQNGECDIICTAMDGGGAHAICHIQVKTAVKQITIEPKQVTVIVGSNEEAATTDLSFTILPEDASFQDVLWTSSNENVLAVNDQGTIKGLIPGKVTVSAKSTQPGSSVKGQIQVTVNQAVQSINLSSSDVTIPAKKSINIKASIYPANAGSKKVEWTSTDNSIATVSNGNIKACAAGECDIVCKAMDESGIESTCHVTVTQLAEGLAVEESKLVIPVDSTFLPTVIFKPENVTDKSLIWTSSNDSICSVNENGEIVAIKPGNCTIKAKTTDGSQKILSISVHVPYLDLQEHEMDILLTRPAKQYDAPVNYNGLSYRDFNVAITPEDALESYYLSEAGKLYFYPQRECQSSVKIYKKNDPDDYTIYFLNIYDRERERAAVNLVNLWLKVQYDYYIFNPTYPIDILLDDKYLGTVRSDREGTWTALTITPGQHTLTFRNAEDPNIQNKADMNVTAGSSSLFRISAKKDRINIDKQDTKSRYDEATDAFAFALLDEYDKIATDIGKQYDYFYYRYHVTGGRAHYYSKYLLLLGEDNSKFLLIDGRSLSKSVNWEYNTHSGTYNNRGVKLGESPIYISYFSSSMSIRNDSNWNYDAYLDTVLLSSQGIETYISIAYPEIASDVKYIFNKMYKNWE